MNPSNANSGISIDQQTAAPLALAFATIERPHVVQRLLKSARRLFPTMPIYVADQSLDVGSMMSFYEHMNVTLVRMPFDAGVCASRNRMVENIKEPFFVLCDDDFVLDESTSFKEALRVLKFHSDVGVVGGRLYDYDGNTQYLRNWELFFHLDRVNRSLTTIPIYQYAPLVREMGEVRVYLCDAVMNFAVMRRSIFDDPKVRWDERFKSNGEHEDFYLNLKSSTSVKVAYLPTMVAFHHHPMSFSRYRTKLRDRVDGWKLFMAKWGIDQHLEIGLGVRTLRDLTNTISADDAAARFFLNDNLCLTHDSESTHLLVTNASELAATGTLKSSGERREAESRNARLLLRARTNHLIGPLDPENASRPAPSSTQAFERYRLNKTLLRSKDLAFFGRPQFMYQAEVRDEADFILWYRFQPNPLSQAENSCAVHLRWLTEDGRALVWRSDELILDSTSREYWTPLLIDVPLFPAGCSVLMFQVIATDEASQQPLAHGFVCSKGKSTSTNKISAHGIEVLALGHPSHSVSGRLIPVDFRTVGSRPGNAEGAQVTTVQGESLALLSIRGIEAYKVVIVRKTLGIDKSILGIIECDKLLLGRESRILAIPNRLLSSLEMWGCNDAGYQRLNLLGAR